MITAYIYNGALSDRLVFTLVILIEHSSNLLYLSITGYSRSLAHKCTAADDLESCNPFVASNRLKTRANWRPCDAGRPSLGAGLRLLRAWKKRCRASRRRRPVSAGLARLMREPQRTRLRSNSLIGACAAKKGGDFANSLHGPLRSSTSEKMTPRSKLTASKIKFDKYSEGRRASYPE
jgi:hypothetical protein